MSNRVFFQSNLILLPQLIDYVVSLTEGPGVMDLYSGVGTFSAYLEDRFEVTAVEINKFCLSLAKSHLKNTRFFTSPVEKWNPKEKKVDTVIVDPPRVGLDKKVPDMIASWNPRCIVYVSCYPPTMHRDVQRLSQLGYKAESLKTENIELRGDVLRPKAEPVHAESGYADGMSLKEVEKLAIEKTLRRWEGNRTKAANELGITRRTLITKIEEYNLDI